MEGNLLISAVRLTRPKNLIIVLAAMTGVAYFILSNYPLVKIDVFDFSLLLLSTVLIAGAGNIINDYFDVSADLINKPKKIIVSKYIQKNDLIWFYATLNALSIGIGLYLSLNYHTPWYIIVNITCSTALFLYSAALKKILFISNLLIALLTGFIPILALSFFIFSNEAGTLAHFNMLKPKLNLIYILAFFAFLQNLAREICKDLTDLEGDKKINVLSIPIRYGSIKTRYIVGSIITTEIICLLVGSWSYSIPIEKSAYTAIAIALILNLCILLIIRNEKLFMNYSQSLLKLSMVIGLSALYF